MMVLVTIDNLSFSCVLYYLTAMLKIIISYNILLHFRSITQHTQVLPTIDILYHNIVH